MHPKVGQAPRRWKVCAVLHASSDATATIWTSVRAMLRTLKHNDHIEDPIRHLYSRRPRLHATQHSFKQSEVDSRCVTSGTHVSAR